METVTLFLDNRQAEVLRKIMQTEKDALLLEFKDHGENNDWKQVKLRVKYDYQLLYIGMKMGSELMCNYETDV